MRMAEYIDKEIVKERLERVFQLQAKTAKKLVDDMPIADVKPVVRGEWKWNKHNGYSYCSNCDEISPHENQYGEYCDCPNFCHNCGADTRRVNE